MVRLEYTPPTPAQLATEFSALKSLALLGEPGWYGPRRLRFLVWALRQRGYTLYPLHRHLPEVTGLEAYKGLERLPQRVSRALVALPPAKVPEALDESAANSIEMAWLVPRSSPFEAREVTLERARELGLELILGLCPLGFMEPVSGPYRLYRAWLRWRAKRQPEPPEVAPTKPAKEG